ncbi:hypothetical protein IPG36_02085 [bacterium]|nr:MAG: hypothetical protein IPG36_02085 [bacterium]
MPATIGITAGNDGPLSERAKSGAIAISVNKLWNVARFILGQLPDDCSPLRPSSTPLLITGCN